MDCTFQFNSAAGSGGALYTNGDVSVQNCVFYANTASNNGGAVYSESLLSIGESTMLAHCTALSGYGAALYSTAQTEVSDTVVQGFDSSASDAAFHHAPEDASSLLVLRRTSFQNVEILFVASSQSNTVIIYNCDSVSTNDVQLSSLLTCEDSELGGYCAAEYCSDATAGIEVTTHSAISARFFSSVSNSPSYCSVLLQPRRAEAGP